MVRGWHGVEMEVLLSTQVTGSRLTEQCGLPTLTGDR